MPGPTLELRRDDLLRHIGRELGWGRDPGGWQEREQTDGEDVLNAALRQFYSPHVLPGEKCQHEWSFLTPWATITTSANVDTYQLPEDFAGLTDVITFLSENSGPCPIHIVSDAKIRRLQQGIQSITGYPDCACITPETSDGQRSQRWKITFYPTPDGEYPLRMRYRSNPYAIIDSAPYPLGGQPSSDALLASVLAAAESHLNDAQGIRYVEYLQKLQAAIYSDRSRNVSSLGYCGDPSMFNYETPPYQPVTRLYLNGTEL